MQLKKVKCSKCSNEYYSGINLLSDDSGPLLCEDCKSISNKKEVWLQKKAMFTIQERLEFLESWYYETFKDDDDKLLEGISHE